MVLPEDSRPKGGVGRGEGRSEGTQRWELIRGGVKATGLVLWLGIWWRLILGGCGQLSGRVGWTPLQVQWLGVAGRQQGAKVAVARVSCGNHRQELIRGRGGTQVIAAGLHLASAWGNTPEAEWGGATASRCLHPRGTWLLHPLYSGEGGRRGRNLGADQDLVEALLQAICALWSFTFTFFPKEEMSFCKLTPERTLGSLPRQLKEMRGEGRSNQ